MPKQNKGEMFDIKNIEQAKRLISEIVQLTEKQYKYTQNSAQMQKIVESQMRDKDKVLELFKELESLSNRSFKEYKISINTVMNDLKGIANGISDDIKAQEQALKSQIDKQVYINSEVSKRLELQKQEQLIHRNAEKITNNKKQLEKEIAAQKEKQYKNIEKIANKEFDQLSNLKKFTSGGRANFVNARAEELRNVFDANYNIGISQGLNNAITSGTNFTTSDVRNISSNSMDAVKDVVDDFSNGSKQFKLGSSVLKEAGNALKDVASLVGKIFKQGMDRQVSLYEQTVQNISFRSGTSAEGYRNEQGTVDNQLSSMGLYDNVRVSEVQQMWQDLANTGMNQQDMFASAIDNVVTQKIVPYLDTTSQSFNLLNSRIDGNFVKQIRGINAANLDIAGNNYATNNLLNQLIDEVQPMSDKALEDLAQGSVELTSYANLLMAEGYSYDQANDIIKQIYKQRKYSDQIMESGSPYEKLNTIGLIENDLNINDLSQSGEILSLFTNNAQTLTSILPDRDTSTLNNLISNIGGTTLFGGDQYSLTTGANKLNKKNITGTDLINKIKSAKDLEEYADGEYTKLMNGDNQSARSKQETALENISTDVAKIREWSGYFWDVGETVLHGAISILTSFLTAKVIGGSIGKGVSALSSTSTGLLSGGGGMALGTIGGVAAGAALVTAIGAGIYTANNKNKEYTSEKELEEFTSSGDSFSQNSTAQKFVSGAGANLSTSGLDNWGKFMKSAGSAMDTWGLGIRKGWTGIVNAFNGKEGWINDDYIGQNAQYFNSIVASHLRDINDASDRAGYYAAFALLLDQVGSLESTKKMGEEISKEDLKGLFTNVDENGVSLYKSYGIDNKLSYFINNNEVPSAKDGVKAWGNIDYKSVYDAPDGSYRYGLDAVPYDGYKAVLHEGEAVLTASTANEMRDLVDEYRDTNTQIADFDVIIQGQTTAILAKMDDIISAITNKNNYTPTSSSLNNINARDERLKNSMLKMISTRQFG